MLRRRLDALDCYFCALTKRNQRQSEVVAAINMAAHTDVISLGELADGLLPHLLTTADGLSARLGFRRDDEVMRWGGREMHGWRADALGLGCAVYCERERLG